MIRPTNLRSLASRFLLIALLALVGMLVCWPSPRAEAARARRHVRQLAARKTHPQKHKPALNKKKTKTKKHAKHTAKAKVEHHGRKVKREVTRKAPKRTKHKAASRRAVHKAPRHIKHKTAASYTCVMNVTAYCPASGGNGGNTALGKHARRGVIAVDPHTIPLGTRMYVQGYGKGTAGDIGRHMRGRRIDICFATRREALKWGRRQVKVRVYRKR